MERWSTSGRGAPFHERANVERRRLAAVPASPACSNVSLRFEGRSRLLISLPADGRHGATRLTLVGRSGDDDSALRAQSGRIFVPLAPAGRRTRPPRAMMQVMMVHELLHAAGLRAHNNAMDDIMTAQMEDGRGGKVHPWGGLGQDMPPCVLGGGTVSRLQALWGQRRSP